MTPGDAPGRIDWYEIYRRLLFGRARLRPWEVRCMTLSEIALALDDDIDEKRPTGGAPKMDAAEIHAHIDWLRRATPRDRLERLREQYR